VPVASAPTVAPIAQGNSKSIKVEQVQRDIIMFQSPKGGVFMHPTLFSGGAYASDVIFWRCDASSLIMLMPHVIHNPCGSGGMLAQRPSSLQNGL